MADVITNNLLTYEELAELLGLHRWTVARWIQQEFLPPAVHHGPRGLLFAPPSPQQVEEAKARKRENEANRIQNIKSTMSHEKWLENKKKRTPEGCVTREEAIELLGCSRDAFKQRIRRGQLAEHSPGYVSLEEIENYKKRPPAPRGPKKGTVRKVETPLYAVPSPKPKELKIAPERPYSPPVAPAAPVPDGFSSYDSAVIAGRSNSAFNGPLGFNLWKHPQLGFRPEAVNVKPLEGWHYYERHGKNGLGQWRTRSQTKTGEILL